MGEESLQIIGLRIGGRPCAVPAGNVLKLVHFAALAAPPGLPPAVIGFLDFGGVTVPVLRTAFLFGLPEPQVHLYTPIVLLRGDRHPIGFVVDSVDRLLTVDRRSGRAVAERHCFNDCVEAEFETAEGTLHLLSVERLLLEEERHRITQLEAAAQERIARWGDHLDG